MMGWVCAAGTTAPRNRVRKRHTQPVEILAAHRNDSGPDQRGIFDRFGGLQVQPAPVAAARLRNMYRLLSLHAREVSALHESRHPLEDPVEDEAPETGPEAESRPPRAPCVLPWCPMCLRYFLRVGHFRYVRTISIKSSAASSEDLVLRGMCSRMWSSINSPMRLLMAPR